MKINCAKCGKHIANVVEPSAIKKGATLYGACYECKTKELHQGGKPEDFAGIMAQFESVFGKGNLK